MPSWLLALFQRLLDLSGKATIAEVWPSLELVVHGGVKFDPYREAFAAVLGSPRVRLQETYPCSEGFIAFGDPETDLLRLVFDHGLFYEFVPVDELDSPRPTRRWLGNVQTGVHYAIVLSTCAGMWAHGRGRHGAVRVALAAAPDLHRADQVCPVGLRRAPDQRGGRSGDRDRLGGERGRRCATGTLARSSGERWAITCSWSSSLAPPPDLRAFRVALDADLSRRNADYLAHRAEGVGLPLPMVVAARPGGFESWMRSRGKLGGQHKVPRMDGTGNLTAELVAFLRESGQIDREIAPGPSD